MLESIRGIKRFCFIQRLAFRGLSIDVTSTEFKIRRPFCIWLGFVCNVIIILSMCKYYFENRADLNKAVVILAPVLQCFICGLKFLIFLNKRSDMIRLMYKIWKLTIGANTKELPIIAEENAKDFKFSLCQYVLVLTACLAATIVPIFVTIIVYAQTKQLYFLHIVKTSYPFDQNQPFNYFVTYCIHMGCSYFAGHMTVAIDTLYSWFILNTVAQFRVLKYNLKKVALSHQRSGTMYYAICRCIKRHQQLIQIANEIDAFFRMLIFAEILANCVVLGFIAYELGHSNGANLENIPFLLAFFICLLTRLVIYCYGGQRIQNESASISNFIYETFSWHSLAIRNKKLLLTLMLRAQKCCVISAFFFTIDWNLFLWIVRTNYSYISLLWSLDEKKSF